MAVFALMYAMIHRNPVTYCRTGPTYGQTALLHKFYKGI